MFVEQQDELVDVVVGDSVHDLPVIFDELHHHVGRVKSDVSLQVQPEVNVSTKSIAHYICTYI